MSIDHPWQAYDIHVNPVQCAYEDPTKEHFSENIFSSQIGLDFPGMMVDLLFIYLFIYLTVCFLIKIKSPIHQ